MKTDGFIRHDDRDIPYYGCRALEGLPWLRHGFSTRWSGGNEGIFNLNSAALGAPDHVNNNRRRLLSALGLENAAPVTLSQIHSNRVYVVETGLTENLENSEGDALVTNIENTALAIKTADCFPVLIVDPVYRAIGAVHSGWRGTLARVLPGAIEEMSRRYNSNPAHLIAAIGPGIRECCFEVGKDVARLFSEAYPEKMIAQPRPSAPGKYMVALAAVLKTQMAQSGIPLENQHDLQMCTCCNTQDFFSWRAEGAATGRMLAVISLVNQC